MVDTVKIGNSWYVLEDICGIVGEQSGTDGGPPAQPAVMLMRGGHLLRMTDLSPEVVEHIRQLRDPAKGQPSLRPVSPEVQAAMTPVSPEVRAAMAQFAQADMPPVVDMSPETVIDVPAEKPA